MHRGSVSIVPLPSLLVPLISLSIYFDYMCHQNFCSLKEAISLHHLILELQNLLHLYYCISVYNFSISFVL